MGCMMNKQKGIRILAVGRALPGKSLSNRDLEKMVDTSDDWIYERTGIRNRYRCSIEDVNTLAAAAAKEAIEKSGIDPGEIGVLIVATSSGKYVFPSAAAMVQKELGLSERILCFDLSAACSGFLYAINAARGLLRDSKKPYALVIGSEQLSRLVDYTDRNTCILFGDGAGAVLFRLSEKEFYHVSFTEGNKEALYIGGIGSDIRYLQMNGREVFRFAVKAMERVIEELLMQSGKRLEEIDHVICHQANARIIQSVSRKHPGLEPRFYMNIERYGNTSAASIPIVLSELEEVGRLQGTTCLMTGFGAGLSYGGILAEL